MKKPCIFPVTKWKDIPEETKERIRRELAVPLPPHLKLHPPPLRFKEKTKKSHKLLILFLTILLLTIFFISLLILTK